MILPSKLAPIQVVIVPIYKNDDDKVQSWKLVERIKNELQDLGIRIKVDDRTEVTPGFKFNDWEMRGVPLGNRNRPKRCCQ